MTTADRPLGSRSGTELALISTAMLGAVSSRVTSVTALRVAAGIWFVFAFVFAASSLNELFEGDAPSVVLGVASALASGWIGYRILFRFSRDIAAVAATLAAVFVVFVVVVIVQGNLQPFPGGMIVIALVALAGVLPWRERRRMAAA